MRESEKKQLISAWILWSLVHCVDAWGLTQGVPLMPQSWLRDLLVSWGGILCQPYSRVHDALSHLPTVVAILLFLLNSALWGLVLAVASRMARIRVCKRTVLVTVAIFVAGPASVPAVSALRHWTGFRQWAASYVVSVPTLTKGEMFEDYDCFTNIVLQLFSMTEVNRQVYGIDVPGLLKANRNEINALSQTSQFVELINRTIESCQGHHFYIGCNYNPFNKEFFKGFVDEGAYPLNTAYCRNNQEMQQGNGLSLRLLYFQANYYTLHDFTSKGVFCPKGAKLRKCNGWTPTEIVATTVPAGVFLVWDYDRHQFFNPDLLRFSPFSLDGRVSLELQLPDGTQKNMVVNPTAPLHYKQPRYDWEPLVRMANRNILYVRLPRMDPKLLDYFRRELPKHKGKPISKVVIDIRNNPGGSDDTWMTLLSLLIKDPFHVHRTFAFKDTELNHRYLDRCPFGKYVNLYGHRQKIAFLNNEDFWVYDWQTTLWPEPDTLGLGCKIFVLCENIYSSAGNFAVTCEQSDQLVTVGLQNSRVLGSGVEPYAFSLPHSKLIFTIGASLDLTDATNALETHHLHLKKRLKPTLQQLLDYYNTGDDVGLEERLNQHDPVFQAVLGMD